MQQQVTKANCEREQSIVSTEGTIILRSRRQCIQLAVLGDGKRGRQVREERGPTLGVQDSPLCIGPEFRR